jgi:hypothetical protein
MMVVRDLSLPILWVAGWTGNTFVWRGNAMDMKTSQLGTAPAASAPTLADHARALRIQSARAVRSFRNLGAFRALDSGDTRPGPFRPGRTRKTGNKPR